VAGRDVDLSLAEIYKRRAAGTIAGRPVTAEGQVGDFEAWRTDIPVRLEATCAGHQLLLFGWIHHDRDLGFDHANIEGSVADQPVTAFISSGDDSGAFAAHGVFADSDFSVRGHVSAGSDAAIQGSVSGGQSTYVLKPHKGPTPVTRSSAATTVP
jgi:hypothetical protein